MHRSALATVITLQSAVLFNVALSRESGINLLLDHANASTKSHATVNGITQVNSLFLQKANKPNASICNLKEIADHATVSRES
jgi:hypothetical protein